MDNSDLQKEREKWEIVGFINPVLYPPVVVKSVLRNPNDPEKWFFAKDPDTDVRSQVIDLPKKDEQGRPLLGGPGFVQLAAPIKYYPNHLCIKLHQDYLTNENLPPIIQVHVDEKALEEAAIENT